MSVIMVQTKCKLNNTELFLKLFHIQSKENENNKKGNGRLKAECHKALTDYIRKRSTEF